MCRFCAWFAWFAWSCAQSLAILLWFFLFLAVVLLLLFCLSVVGCAALARFDRLAKRIELGLETLDRLLRGLDLLLRALCLRSLFKLTPVSLMTLQITSKKVVEPITVLLLLQPLVALFVPCLYHLELLAVLRALAPVLMVRAFIFCAGLLCLTPLGRGASSDRVVPYARSSARHVAGSELGAVLQSVEIFLKKFN